jgi:hypothetical protein
VAGHTRSRSLNEHGYIDSESLDHRQGANFIHEEINTLVKKFLPPGVPTGETWQRVCRKGEYLKTTKEKCLQTSEIASNQTSRSYKIFEQEVLMMGRKLCKSRILNMMNPKVWIDLGTGWRPQPTMLRYENDCKFRR